jgi:PadR family transcriptional regulator, regulatory protein AphA
MSLRHALLGLLADRPYSGWQLLKHFEGSLAYAWPALHSQIYPELARLREAGLIEQTGMGPRGAKEYSLTETGRDEIERWLRETTPSRNTRDDALLRVFFLWLLEPDEAAAYLDREVEFQRRLLDDLERIASSPARDDAKERSYRLALDFGLRITRTRREWAEDAAQEMRAQSDEASQPRRGRRA